MNTAPAQAVSATSQQDAALVRTWLHGRQPNTALAYERDIGQLLGFAGKPIVELKLEDLQAWSDSMDGAAQSTRARRLAAAKSLLTFAHRLGWIPENPGAALRVQKAQETTAERILSETDVLRTIGAETDPRRHALLRLLYVCGVRATESAGLRWRDLAGNEKKGGTARVLGKGAKLRTVAIPADLWRELSALSPAATPDSPVIPGRDGRPMTRQGVWRAVKRAVRRSGVDGGASPHWMRHSHCSHALDNGASLAGVRDGAGHASIATTSKYLHARKGEASASFIKG